VAEVSGEGILDGVRLFFIDIDNSQRIDTSSSKETGIRLSSNSVKGNGERTTPKHSVGARLGI
jgi:hypothetical protein